MSPEQLLLGGLSVVTSALCYIAKLLWKEAQDCKRDRVALRKEVEDLRGAGGRAQGKLDVMERCTVPSCPFRPAVEETRSTE